MTPIDAEHAALLRGVARNLKDATARKVYADWLQERGTPAEWSSPTTRSSSGRCGWGPTAREEPLVG